MNTTRATIAAVWTALCLIVGAVIGWDAARMKKPQTEPPAVAILHPDGSRTIERTTAPPPAPLPLPKGAKARIRSEVIEVKPTDKPSTIQVDTVEMQDGTERVTIKGDAVDGGMDFPVVPAIRMPVKKWTVGATWDGKQVGAIALRDMGPVSVGIIAQRDHAAVFVGVRF